MGALIALKNEEDFIDNVVDFTKYKESKIVPTLSLTEWITQSIAKAEKFAAEQAAIAARKKHNAEVIQKWKLGPTKGDSA